MFGLVFLFGIAFRARTLAVVVAMLLALVCLTVLPAMLGILASQSMAGVWR